MLAMVVVGGGSGPAAYAHVSIRCSGTGICTCA